MYLVFAPAVTDTRSRYLGIDDNGTGCSIALFGGGGTSVLPPGSKGAGRHPGPGNHDKKLGRFIPHHDYASPKLASIW